MVRADAAFASIPLSYLALPGADNAGTFNLDPQAIDTTKGSDCRTFSPDTPLLTAQKVQRFSATQDETISGQLDQGVRWIDLKVGYNGDGNPIAGWRVTQNLYSNWPLAEYLDEVANWAAHHPTEAVVVDLSTICYDHDPTVSVQKGLWANFATKSAEKAGPATLADVTAQPSSFGGSLASATLRELIKNNHNVVVLVPSTAKFVQVLRRDEHVTALLTAPPGRANRSMTEVENSEPRIAPTNPFAFSTANRDLAAFPTSTDPALGSLRGRGFYVSKLAYELQGAPVLSQQQVMSDFVGLIASLGPYPAWVAGLGDGEYTQILTRWGHLTNVVLADGVDLGGFTAAVIERNGR